MADSSQLPRTVRAATLTYRVAPSPEPDDTEDLFTHALLVESDRQTAAAVGASPVGCWLSRAWEGVKGYAQENIVSMRQAEFLRHFSRQLEYRAEELDMVVVSCRADIVSMAEPVPGMLYATNWGVYFCSDEAAATDSIAMGAHEMAAAEGAAAGARPDPNNTSGRLARRVPLTDASSSPPPPQDAPCSKTAIKERIDFLRVAALLPSIVAAEDSQGPGGGQQFLVFRGVPSAQVMPTALQIFTVLPAQILQFANIRDVAVRPPPPAGASGGQAASPVEPTGHTRDSEGRPVFGEVFQPQEYPLLRSMPAHLDTFKVTALLWRLWRLRLESAGLPVLNPAAEYADPH